MMMNMEDKNTDNKLITIHFDDDVNDKFHKMFLMEHSAYFEAMFSGNFLESAEQKIHIQVSIDLSMIKTFFFLLII